MGADHCQLMPDHFPYHSSSASMDALATRQLRFVREVSTSAAMNVRENGTVSRHCDHWSGVSNGPVRQSRLASRGRLTATARCGRAAAAPMHLP
jgi:hypothetical protein